jgi:hypothetical protein
MIHTVSGFVIPENVIGLVITGVFGVTVTVLGGIMARRGSKLGSRENRAPDVQEMWTQQEHDRQMRQMVEDIWWSLRRAFQSYFRRVTTAIAKLDLTEAQKKSFQLSASEQKAIDMEPESD